MLLDFQCHVLPTLLVATSPGFVALALSEVHHNLRPSLVEGFLLLLCPTTHHNEGLHQTLPSVVDLRIFASCRQHH